MKATNHPSDKMTIKNNNGDLLLEIDAEGVQSIKFKDGNEITGEDISSAIGKADTLPTVTSADAGRTLVVDGDGKIVAGSTIPTIEITQAEIGGILAELGTDLYGATNNFQYKVYQINDASIAASIGAKIASAYAKGTFANLSVYGMGTMGCYINAANVYYSPIGYFHMLDIEKHLALGMATTILENRVFITVIFALATEVIPK